MFPFRKLLILAHRYLGIALCLLFVMWFVSAIAMIYAGGMPRLAPDERLRRMPPLDLARVRVSPADAAAKAGLRRNPGRVTLLTVMDRPAYRFGGREPAIVFADSGDLLGDVSPSDSLAIAARFTGAPASALRYGRELDTADQWTIGQRGDLPVHKISVDDAARTELYVSEPLGEVVMVTTRGSRSLAWVAAIPHWLYFTPLRLNDRLWTRVVVWSSGIGAVGALLGLILGVTQYRTKYVGWMRWHYLVGVVFGTVTLTWAFSGLLSMEPFEWFSRASGGARGIPQALTGGPLDLSAFPPFDPGAWKQAMGGRQAKEIVFRRIQGDAYYAVSHAGRAQLLVHASPLEIRREPFSADSVLERLREGYPGAPIAESAVLSSYDAYYYDRDHEAPLPVVRVKFGDADRTWVYVDGTSQLVARFTARQRLERWLYHGLHSLDFPFLYDKRPLWDIVVIALLLGGAALSVIGAVIGLKRVRRIARLA